MSYDAAAVRLLGVDPNKWEWFRNDYSQYPVETEATLAPRMRRASPQDTKSTFIAEAIPYTDSRPARALKPVLLTISLVFLTLFVSGFAAAPYLLYASQSGGNEMPEFGAAFLLMAAVVLGAGASLMSLFAAMSFSRNLALRVIGMLFGGIFVCGFISNIISGHLPLVAALGAGILGAVIFAVMFNKSLPYTPRDKTSHMASYPVTQSPNEEDEYYAPRYYPAPGAVHGTPGGVAGATGKFSQGAIAAGVKGEESTASLLRLLLKIPGSSVFHGLKFPGSETADVDHAVSHGKTVYLIDSKMFRAGTYEWDTQEEKIVSPGNVTRKNYMDVVAEGYRKMLPHQTEVVPIVIIHGSNVTIGNNRWSSQGVGLFTAEEAMEFMGTRMCDNMPTWSDTPSIRGDLVDSMK